MMSHQPNSFTGCAIEQCIISSLVVATLGDQKVGDAISWK